MFNCVNVDLTSFARVSTYHIHKKILKMHAFQNFFQLQVAVIQFLKFVIFPVLIAYYLNDSLVALIKKNIFNVLCFTLLTSRSLAFPVEKLKKMS